MSKKMSHLTPPTFLNAPVINTTAQLSDWAERMRVEYGKSVHFTCSVLPVGYYTQYEFMRGEAVAFSSTSDKDRVDPGGKIKGGFVEGIRTEDRFLALRILDSTGEFVYDKTTTVFYHLEQGGFEIVDNLSCHEPGISHVLLLANHLKGSPHVRGMLITPTNLMFRQTLIGNKNAPPFEVIFQISPSEENKGTVPGKLVFDFAGRFSKEDKSDATDKILTSGNLISDGTSDKVDYLVAAESVLKSQETMTSKMVQAVASGTKIISCAELSDIIKPKT
jgi:hypothetical protein